MERLGPSHCTLWEMHVFLTLEHVCTGQVPDELVPKGDKHLQLTITSTRVVDGQHLMRGVHL